MNGRNVLWVRWVLALALVVGARPVLAASGRERSLGVYPAQRIPLTFSHRLHLDAGAECLTCHDPARKSVQSSDLFLPKHPECEACHDIDKAKAGQKVDPPAACNTCHPGFDPTAHKEPARVEFAAPNLIFPHKVHVDRKVDCTTCHGKMADITLATRMQLPKMETCLQCHDGRAASSKCSTCHVTQPSGRLQLSFASGLLRPQQGNPYGMDHGPRFEFNHGNRASLNRTMCQQCHAESECQQCHNALQKPLSVHPNDFITLHPVQAKMQVTRCEACHRYQSFCAACHERTGVGVDANPSLRPRNLSVHPDLNTWVNVIGPKHHGIAASRDIRQCMSCHREDSCLTCHSDSDRFGVLRQVNPHPTGFAQMCKALAGKNDRACLKCHTEATLAQKGCR
jgi:hypothetical protein